VASRTRSGRIVRLERERRRTCRDRGPIIEISSPNVTRPSLARLGSSFAIAFREWNHQRRIGKLASVPLSFEEAFAAEFRPLYRYLRRRVGAEEAEELAAATFATAYANWDKFDTERPLRPWLYGIASNHVRHYWRREGRMLRAYARTGVDPVSGEDPYAEHAHKSIRHRELARALALVRSGDRELLLLRVWAGLSDQEIALALNLPIGTVKSRLHRTLARLRNQLDPGGQQQSNQPRISIPEEHS
jgi:RNA polymerase sigma factor (sigma-70 family)